MSVDCPCQSIRLDLRRGWARGGDLLFQLCFIRGEAAEKGPGHLGALFKFQVTDGRLRICMSVPPVEWTVEAALLIPAEPRECCLPGFLFSHFLGNELLY